MLPLPAKTSKVAIVRSVVRASSFTSKVAALKIQISNPRSPPITLRLYKVLWKNRPTYVAVVVRRGLKRNCSPAWCPHWKQRVPPKNWRLPLWKPTRETCWIVTSMWDSCRYPCRPWVVAPILVCPRCPMPPLVTSSRVVWARHPKQWQKERANRTCSRHNSGWRYSNRIQKSICPFCRSLMA